MAKPFGEKTHTQESIVVYVSFEEKKEIKNIAKFLGTSMSKYLLDLYKKDKGRFKKWVRQSK